MKAITIELGNVGSKEQALRISEKLNGKTYYNFQVDYALNIGFKDEKDIKFGYINLL